MAVTETKKNRHLLTDGRWQHVFRIRGVLEGVTELTQNITLPKGVVAGMMAFYIGSAPSGNITLRFTDRGFEASPGNVEFGHYGTLTGNNQADAGDAFTEGTLNACDLGSGRALLGIVSNNAGDTQNFHAVLSVIATERGTDSL